MTYLGAFSPGDASWVLTEGGGGGEGGVLDKC